MKNISKKIKILNIYIDSISRHNLITKDLKGVIFTPNVDHLIKLQTDQQFYNLYNKADWVLCDSKIIKIFSKFLSTNIKEVITGSDLFPDYCKQIASNISYNKRVFILGGTSKNILKKTINKLHSWSSYKYVVGGHSPDFGFENNPKNIKMIIDMIKNSKANVLAIGLGAPKQEKIVYQIIDDLPNIELVFAVGATIDFISGEVKRAPLWMRKFALEWLYRMLTNPKRLAKRYLIDDLPIFWLILKQKLGFYHNPFSN